MRVSRLFGCIGGGVLFALTRSASADLPPPSRDSLGDNVRVVEWEPSLPIPGLSRFAVSWLVPARTGQTRPMLRAIADRVYGEREQRIRDFIASRDVSLFLGARPSTDVLRELPGDHAASALAFQQMFLHPTGDLAVVSGARVSVILGADGVSVRGFISTFQPDLDPPRVQVTSEQAVSAALEATLDLGALEVADSMPPELVVQRAPAPLAGVRPSSIVRRANDRSNHLVRLYDTERPTRMIEVPVDASTGDVGRPRLLSADGGSGLTTHSPTEYWTVIDGDLLGS
jgi:hypothetical protein